MENLRLIFPGKIHCGLTVPFSFHIWYLASATTIARLVRIWFLYFSADERVKNQQHDNDSKNSMWFADHRHLFKNTHFLWKIVGILAIPPAVAALILFTLQSKGESSMYDPDCLSTRTIKLFSSVLAGNTTLTNTSML
jgi:hypothetical protein